MKKLTVLASACALGLSVSAASTWFDAKISTYTAWPNPSGIVGGSWQNTDGATLGTSRLAIDADISEPLTFKATDAKTLDVSSTSLKINTTIKFTPFAADAKPDIQEDAKAAVIVVETGDGTYKYFVLAKKADANENEWRELDVEAQKGVDAEVAIEIKNGETDNLLNVDYTFAFGGPVSTRQMTVYSESETLGYVAASGSGEMSVLSSTDEPCAYNITINNDISEKGVAVAVVSNMTTGAEIALTEGVYPAKYGDKVYVYFTSTEEGKAFVGNEYHSLTVSGNMEVNKDNTADIEVRDAKARIGTKLYISLCQAYSNVVAGQTIELIKDFEGLSFKMNNSKSITLDLCGHTWTAHGSPSNTNIIFDINSGSSLKVTNGTVKATSDIAYAAYTYAEMLELVDVNLDLTDMTALDGSEDTRYNTAFTIQNGSVTFKRTTVTLKDGMRLATFIDRAGHQYNMGTLTIDGCTVPGDIFLLGDGKLAFANEGNITGNVYAGAASCSGYTDTNCVVGCGFVARVGNVRGAKMDATATGNYEVTAQLFFNIGDAITALATTTFDKKVVMLGNAELPEAAELTADCTFDLNGKTVTVADQKSLAVTDCSLAVTNSDITAGGLVVAGSIIDNGSIDLWNIPYGVGGLIAHQGGSIAIGGSGSVKFMSAWAADSANALKAKTANFMTASKGAKVITGNEYTYNGSYFEVANAVAETTVTTTIIGTEYTTDFTDSFTTLAAAVTAAKEDATIKLVGAANANGIATTRPVTLDINDKMLTLDADNVLTLGSTTAIVNDGEATAGGLTINGQVVVNGSLDFSSLGWGVGGLIQECAGSLKIGATSIVKFWAGNDPNNMETMKPGFLSESESGATFVSGSSTWTFDGATWNLKQQAITPGGSPVQVTADSKEAAEAAAAAIPLCAYSPNTTIVSDADYTAYFKRKVYQVGATTTYNVTAVLDSEKVEPDKSLTDAAADLSAIAAGTKTAATISNAKPGLYYSFKYSDTPDFATSEEGTRVMAESTSVEVSMPKGENKTVRFYKLQVTTTEGGIVQ